MSIKAGDTVFFLFKDKVREAQVIEKVTTETYCTSYANVATTINYEIDNNPAGSQYTKRFSEGELFKTKEELLNSL